MGKPVVLDKNLDPELKKKVDKGWQDNAFNQYVSDMISVHRNLPDPRDEWYVPIKFFSVFILFVLNRFSQIESLKEKQLL